MPLPGVIGRWRSPFALTLAAAAVVAAAPPALLPWNAAFRTALGDPGWPLLSAIAALLLLGAALALPRALVRSDGRDHTALAVGLLLLLEPLLHLAVLGLGAWKPSTLSVAAVLPAAPAIDLWDRAMTIAVVAFVVPLCEEAFFRGRLLPWLRERMGAASALSLSTLWFAAAHGEIHQAALAVPLGLVLGALRLGGAHLGACVFAHAVHNGIFVTGSPAVVSLPWIDLALAAAGAGLALWAWVYHHRPAPGPHRRFAAAALLIALLIALLAPLYAAAKDRLWVLAAHRIVVWWRADNAAVLARVARQLRVGRPQRAAALARLLVDEPCQTQVRQTLLVELLQPGHAPALIRLSGDADAAAALDEIRAQRQPSPALDAAAREIGLRFPEAMGALVLEFPEVVGRLWPLPAREAEAAAQLAALPRVPDRKLMLGALEQRFPGRVAEVLFRVPPASVTSAERRHLRFHYDDFAARLAALATRDAERAQAFGYEAPAP